MNCPTCGQPVRDADTECVCGEVLTQWRRMAGNGAALRQHGLALAGAGDFLGAALAFLEAALTTPLDGTGLVDAAKALYHLGRPDDALRWLGHAESLHPAGGAAAVAAAIRTLQAQAQAPPEAPAAPNTETGVEAAPPEAGPRPLLALGPLPCRQGWGSRSKADAPVWEKVLAREQQPGDWRLGCPVVEETLKASGSGVLHYVLGLGHWQQGSRDAAGACFAACLKTRPPFLNPAAYYLCLHLDDPQRARAARERLGRVHGPRELETCLGRLEEWLAAHGEAERLGVLRRELLHRQDPV
jgi:tetratricopeptide (TPR) repeat protein